MASALDALTGDHGRIVELVGEPGAGKTCLLTTLVGEANRRGVRTVRGRWVETDLGSPAADLRELLDAPPGQPLLVVLDDFHWADPTSVDVVDRMLRWPLDKPFSVVLAHRPRQAPARLRNSLAHAVEAGTLEQVELPPLTHAQCAALLGRPHDAEGLAELRQESRGIPLYLLALAGAIRSPGPAPGDVLYKDVPGHYRALILGDVETLTEAESTMLSVAAVIGDEVDAKLLTTVTRAVTGHSAARCAAALTALVGRDLLRAVEDRPAYTFRHPVLRRLLYADIQPVWRDGVHRATLARLPDTRVTAATCATHVAAAPNLPGPDDLRILLRAADEAMDADPAAAAHWFRAALRTLDAGDSRRIDLTLSLAKAVFASGQLVESRTLLHELLSAIPADNRHARVSAVALCALMDAFLGNCTEAAALLTAESEALPADDPPLEAVTIGVSHMLLGVLGGPWPTCEQMALALRDGGHLDDMARATQLALRALHQITAGHAPDPEDILTDAARGLDRHADVEIARFPEYLAILGWAETLTGRFYDAERHFRRGVELTRRTRRSYALPTMLGGYAVACRNRGAVAKALVAACEARRLAETMNAPYLRGMALTIEAWSLTWTLERGNPRAAEFAQRAVDILTAGRSRWIAQSTFTLASAELFAGNAQRSITLIMDCGGGPDLPRLPTTIRTISYELLTAAAAELGDDKAASWWAEAAAGVAAEMNASQHTVYANAARAHVLRIRGDHVGAAALYQAAAELCADDGMVCVRSEMLAHAAACLVEAGQLGPGRAALELAEEIARRCGATRVLSDIATIRGAAWKPESTGPSLSLSALTGREREIARIAGEGKRTKEIADELTLSPRTVDVHLTRIYRKLGVRSRAALVRLMTELRQDASRRGSTP